MLVKCRQVFLVSVADQSPISSVLGGLIGRINVHLMDGERERVIFF